MGATDSKPTRLTKEQRADRENLKNTVINQRKNEIDKLQENILKSSANNSNQVIVTKDLVAVIQIGETAKTQLNRGGNALTKSDLVAIIIALDNTYRTQLVQLNQLTISDLNCMIRSIIYDPSRILNDKTKSQVKYLV